MNSRYFLKLTSESLSYNPNSFDSFLWFLERKNIPSPLCTSMAPDDLKFFFCGLLLICMSSLYNKKKESLCFLFEWKNVVFFLVVFFFKFLLYYLSIFLLSLLDFVSYFKGPFSIPKIIYKIFIALSIPYIILFLMFKLLISLEFVYRTIGHEVVIKLYFFFFLQMAVLLSKHHSLNNPSFIHSSLKFYPY